VNNRRWGTKRFNGVKELRARRPNRPRPDLEKSNLGFKKISTRHTGLAQGLNGAKEVYYIELPTVRKKNSFFFLRIVGDSTLQKENLL
jgi:hypothetical protein